MPSHRAIASSFLLAAAVSFVPSYAWSQPGPPVPPAPPVPAGPAPQPTPAPQPIPAPPAPGDQGPLPPEVPPPPAPPFVPPHAPPMPPFMQPQHPPPMLPWPMPPPPERKRKEAGVSKNGLPLTQRGAIGIDGGFFSAGDEDAAGAGIDIFANVPILDRSFIEARVPIALADRVAIGNVDLGMRHVLRPLDAFWVGIGGGIGMPTLNEDTARSDAYEIGTVPSAHWYFHEFHPSAVPVRAGVTLEGHLGEWVSLRFMTNVVVMIGYENNDEHELSIPHAVEFQVGHKFGGGLRLQGVALPTLDNSGVGSSFEDDLYQLALEPFGSYEGELGFARLGIMMPLDGQLGAPFVQSWGLRLATGVRLE